MFKRMIAGLLALGMIFTIPGLGYAGFSPRGGAGINVNAVSTVPADPHNGVTVKLGTNIGTNDGKLTFESVASFQSTIQSQLFVADQSVGVEFKDNNIYTDPSDPAIVESFKVLAISTDNRNGTPQYTGLNTGAGLVHTVDTTTAAPLMWTVWETEDQADAYDGEASTPTTVDDSTGGDFTVTPEWPIFDSASTTDPRILAFRPAGTEVLDTRTHRFVADLGRDQADFLGPDDAWTPGFGTFVSGVQGTFGGIANAPVDATPDISCDEYLDCDASDPNAACASYALNPDNGNQCEPLTADGDQVVNDADGFNSGPGRTVSQTTLDPVTGRATVWLRLAANFSGQPAGDYSTNTLRVELYSQTP